MAVIKSTCVISYFKNDVQKTRLEENLCPVKNCSVNIRQYQVPFQRYKGQMRYLPFCPEHGVRIHKNSGFVYYNGPSKDDLITATKRNLMFHGDFYTANFFKKGAKSESGRLCYESSEDAVSYNVFTELLANGQALRRLVSYITKKDIKSDVDLYLWGGKIDLKSNEFTKYKPLELVRHHLEKDIKFFGTEPDIMLVVPGKVVICIEAKFGSKNPQSDKKRQKPGEKPVKTPGIIERYYRKNRLINTDNIFDLDSIPKPFYEQLFRNIVFAASMARYEDGADWYVANLRSRHVMNLKKNAPESLPVMRNIRSFLRSKYKKRFTHITWEDIFNTAVKNDRQLVNLSWYLKNKTLNCGRAFNII